MIFKGFGNDWVAGAPRGLQHRCPDDKSGAGFNSQAFPQSINFYPLTVTALYRFFLTKILI